MKKPMWNAEAAKAYETGQGVELVNEPHPHYEPVAWKWHQAPVKTSWGDGMVVADLASDKDHTVSIYCERDQTAKVEAMFTPPQRTWVGLTDEEIDNFLKCVWGPKVTPTDFIRAIEAKLKELNNA